MSEQTQPALPLSRQPVAGSSQVPAPQRPARTPGQIESDMAAVRDRLSGNVDALAARLAPQTVKERAKDTTRSKAQQWVATARAKAQQWGAMARARGEQSLATARAKASDPEQLKATAQAVRAKATQPDGTVRPDVVRGTAAVVGTLLLLRIRRAIKRRRRSR